MGDAPVITGEVPGGASDGAGSHDALGWKGWGWHCEGRRRCSARTLQWMEKVLLSENTGCQLEGQPPASLLLGEEVPGAEVVSPLEGERQELRGPLGCHPPLGRRIHILIS